MAEDRWYSVDEIADYLGVKRDTIYKWIVRKRLGAVSVTDGVGSVSSII